MTNSNGSLIFNSIRSPQQIVYCVNNFNNMAFQWVAGAAKLVCDANPIIPGTDRHLQNVVLQRNTLVSQETCTADIGNGRIVTVTVNDCIRKSGRAKWEVIGICSDGTTEKIVETKSNQPDKMKVAEAVVRKFL